MTTLRERFNDFYDDSNWTWKQTIVGWLLWPVWVLAISMAFTAVAIVIMVIINGLKATF